MRKPNRGFKPFGKESDSKRAPKKTSGFREKSSGFSNPGPDTRPLGRSKREAPAENRKRGTGTNFKKDPGTSSSYKPGNRRRKEDDVKKVYTDKYATKGDKTSRFTKPAREKSSGYSPSQRHSSRPEANNRSYRNENAEDKSSPKAGTKKDYQKRPASTARRTNVKESIKEAKTGSYDRNHKEKRKPTYHSRGQFADHAKPEKQSHPRENRFKKTRTDDNRSDEKRGRKGQDSEIRKKEVHENIRLNRYISNAGICSRREADKLIAAGLVSVNGEVVTEMGYQVKSTDDIRFNGQRLSREKKVYIVMNKPKDSITTLSDPEGRNTVMDLLGRDLAERVYPVGRLDRNTTGVLILTNDGDLAQRLMHPKYEVEKVYKATLNKVFKGEDFWQLTNGVELEDGFIKPDQIAYPDPKNKTEVGVQIHSGRNRIIHRIFEHLGYVVEKLDRVAYGEFTRLKMKRGEWRYLDEKEIKKLKRMAKLA